MRSEPRLATSREAVRGVEDVGVAAGVGEDTGVAVVEGDAPPPQPARKSGRAR
jgi:hypothetical protein